MYSKSLSVLPQIFLQLYLDLTCEQWCVKTIKITGDAQWKAGGPTSDRVVCIRPGPQHHQNQGSHHRLQEDQDSHTAPLYISGEEVERVDSVKFLGTHITKDLTWTLNTYNLVKRVQQRMFFLKQSGLAPQLLRSYRSTIENILCQGCTVAQQLHSRTKKDLSWVVKAAHRRGELSFPTRTLCMQSACRGEHRPSAWTTATRDVPCSFWKAFCLNYMVSSL